MLYFITGTPPPWVPVPIWSPPKSLELLAMNNVTNENIGVISKTLTELVSNTSLSSDNVSYTAIIMDKITNQVDTFNLNVGQRLIKTADSLLDTYDIELTESHQAHRGLTKVLKALENITPKLKINRSIEISEPNIVLVSKEVENGSEVVGFGVRNYEDLVKDGNVYELQERQVNISNLESGVIFPRNIVDKSNTRLSFIVYKRNSFFTINPNTSQVYNVSSHVISVSIYVNGTSHKYLSEPVKLVFKPFTKNSSYKCVFWDFSMNHNYGGWSGEGCWYFNTVEGRVICLCNHLTNFAILADWHPDVIIPTSHQRALNIISGVGLTFSSLGLAATIATFLALR